MFFACIWATLDFGGRKRCSASRTAAVALFLLSEIYGRR